MIICSVDDCSNESRTTGLCAKHYARYRHHGYTDLLKNRTAWNKKDYIDKVCPTCNIGFSVKPSLDRVNYCSISCGKIGKPSWKKGQRGVQVAWNKGLNSSDPRIAAASGSNHYNWRGGSKHGERVRFRDTMQQLVFKRDLYTCQICEQEGGSLQVDHIKGWAAFPELRFEMSNCRTLCMACHYFITFKRKLPNGVVWGHNLKKRSA